MAILGFKQQFPWKEPTWFKEKILIGVGETIIVPEHHLVHDKKRQGYVLNVISVPKKLNPKKHTLRIDPHNLWKAGRKIDMVYRGAGYQILDHFNKGIADLQTCVSTQKIEIITEMFKGEPRVMNILIDGKLRFIIPLANNITIAKRYSDYMTFIRNDGFESVSQFYRWFHKGFAGKIIHFSDLRY